MQDLIFLGLTGSLVILTLMMVCFFAYKVKAQSFEFSAVILKLFSVSIKVRRRL
jgi:hypothetical protein